MWLSLRRAGTLLAVLFSMAAILVGTARAAGKNTHTRAEPSAFAKNLVAAARKQTWVPVIYNPAYTKIAYPNGDVPWYQGVCTDVVVRAYRDLGIDLQELVHRSRLGSGDTNIDHRRVEVQRKFFARHGTSLGTSGNTADYRAGDIVTFYVPDGTLSKTHVAIVSDRSTSAGVPLIIHNRGWGVQEEDWLFSPSAKITDHYRYAPVRETRASR